MFDKFVLRADWFMGEEKNLVTYHSSIRSSSVAAWNTLLGMKLLAQLASSFSCALRDDGSGKGDIRVVMAH